MNALQLAEGYKYLYRHVNRLSFTMDLPFEAVRHNARWEERRARNRLDINAMSESDCKKHFRFSKQNLYKTSTKHMPLTSTKLKKHYKIEVSSKKGFCRGFVEVL